MKCKDCDGRMVLIDKKEYTKNEDWKPQSYICEKCNRVEYL